MFKAKDIMKGDVITVTRQTPIYEAIRILVEGNVTGLPVVDEDMRIVGIVTEKDVLALLYNIEDRNGKVEDFVTEEVVCFDGEDSLIGITECLIGSHIRRVPITSQDGLSV